MEEKIQLLIKLLTSNYNLILTGAPGTGKTYIAKQIAAKMILDGEYSSDKEKDAILKEQCCFVQFHPSYDYTDFVEGLHSRKDDEGNIYFELRDGIFKAFCKKAIEKGSSTVNISGGIQNERVPNDDNFDFDKAYNKFINEVKNRTQGGKKMVIPSKNYEDGTIILGVTQDNVVIATGKTSVEALEYSITYEHIRKLAEKFKNYDEIYSATAHDIKDTNKHPRTSLCRSLLLYTYKHYWNTPSEPNVDAKKFVFIIDEINRGNLSKIFGELLFSIDPDYRGEKWKVQTQHQNLIEDKDIFHDGFYVPENVYIIGTMNDIDHNAESFDYAMSRRFTWNEIKAIDYVGMLDKLGGKKTEAKNRMNNLNKEIEKIEGLSSAYHIGPAYFLKLSLYEEEKDGGWKSLWKNHIERLLRRYLEGSKNIEANMKKLKAAYNNDLTK